MQITLLESYTAFFNQQDYLNNKYKGTPQNTASPHSTVTLQIRDESN